MSAATVTTRLMCATDAAIVAQLHAASWRVAYRDILSPAYLAGAIDADRYAVWSQRLLAPDANTFGIVAEVDQRPAGFVFVRRVADPLYGSLIDNFHVSQAFLRTGIGRRLFAAVSDELRRRDWPRPLHLWVYDANHAARRFYEALGGMRVESALRGTPDGQLVPAGRYLWSD